MTAAIRCRVSSRLASSPSFAFPLLLCISPPAVIQMPEAALPAPLATPAGPVVGDGPVVHFMSTSVAAGQDSADSSFDSGQGTANPPDALSGRASSRPAETRTEGLTAAPASASPVTPSQVYRASCLECHESDGRGEASRDGFPKIPDFTSPSWQTSRNDAELSRSILEGKGKSMPRMKGKLGSVDVKRMVAFVRAFRDGKQVVDDEPQAPAASGRAGSPPNEIAPRPSAVGPSQSTHTDPGIQEGSRNFQRLCVKCHAADGKGTGIRESLPTLPDFTNTAWQGSRSDAHLVVSVLDGKGDGMPSFRDKVSRDQARHLVTFVRSFVPELVRQAGATQELFESRFRQLEEEFEALRKQSRDLSSSIPRAQRNEPGSVLPSSREKHP